MINFYVKKNSTLPVLRIELLLDGRNLYNVTPDVITASTIYFSMVDKKTNILKVGKGISTVTNENGKTYISYKFTGKSLNTVSDYVGQFFVTNSSGSETLPLTEEIKITVIDSIFDTNTVECCIQETVPVVIPSQTPTVTPTLTKTPLPSKTPVPTRTSTPTTTPTKTVTPTQTKTPTQTPTNTPTRTITPTLTPTTTPTKTVTPTQTKTPTITPTSTTIYDCDLVVVGTSRSLSCELVVEGFVSG